MDNAHNMCYDAKVKATQLRQALSDAKCGFEFNCLKVLSVCVQWCVRSFKLRTHARAGPQLDFMEGLSASLVDKAGEIEQFQARGPARDYMQ